MEKFILVYDEQSKDCLISYGYTILQSQSPNVYIFLNDGKCDFAKENIHFSLTNKMFCREGGV